MATNLTVILEDRPGELARLGQATGEAGINIEGLCAMTGEGRGMVQLLVADEGASAAHRALEDAGLGVADQRQVLVIDIRDQPGTLGELARRFAEANVNIELAYSTFGGVKLVVATDDVDAARAALE